MAEVLPCSRTIPGMMIVQFEIYMYWLDEVQIHGLEQERRNSIANTLESFLH